MAEKKSESKLDNLPEPVNGILGVLSLLGITAAGFGVFFLFDILLLDFDPIGKLIGMIF